MKRSLDLTGLSRRSVTRETENLYLDMKANQNQKLNELLNALRTLCKRQDSLVNASHDIWSSLNSKSYLGFNLHVMDVTSSPWKISVKTLACVHHASPHTAERNLEKSKQILDDWGLFVTILQAATQDTTGNSIGTFQSVETLLRLCLVLRILANYLCNILAKKLQLLRRLLMR